MKENIKHSNISLFVPHQGCPQNCSFCNQKRITGTNKKLTHQDIEQAVYTAYSCNKELSNTELAFFGGSFTAIEREYMMYLLEKGKELVEKYKLFGIRISTRPDFINEEILDILKEHRVTSIELGAQSMNDEVLLANDRGHSSDDVRKASNLIKNSGFELGLQMMTGLYMSDKQKDLQTIQEIIKLEPKTLRVYPTIIFKETRLYDLYLTGEYKAQSLEDAVETCSEIIRICDENKVKIIRMGLHSSDELKNAVAGANHPAFMQLCQSKIYLDKFLKELKNSGKYEIFVNEKDLSSAMGQKKTNIQKLENLGFFVKITGKKDINLKEFLIKELI